MAACHVQVQLMLDLAVPFPALLDTGLVEEHTQEYVRGLGPLHIGVDLLLAVLVSTYEQCHRTSHLGGNR